ncbi:beta-phosphoglucomutase family hydrolase [Prosthecochloris sp. SCSIO W1103]|uniref:beta-phosphoglucomutase family hydrolase n=1 Tax=Prosthecochloris sp. SCSIO W1103 TaxID=2992244 RepID=UPI00223CC2A5|nr:beta-phosphoglucomutase family hydrolase [Prosthecochloris sp. SCSIO W1103]UZJ36648.1 beta-phosphoglucomutase family hydrolase [Prosthecochloris sp. SCSIO W1103]
MLKGVIFDLDGVVTGTAKIHSLAWESMFNEFLKEYAEANNEPFVPFDPGLDYLNYVDGKPRMEGVRSFLESREIELPFGEIDDVPEMPTVCGLGNRKNQVFTEILIKEGPEVFQSTVDFIHELKSRGVRIGIASSSRNCKLILELAKLEHLFETRVDGEVSLELKLKGKPNPDIFTTAADNLGLHPHDCVVVEDAISGVQAGSAGNFGLVLGIAREIEGMKLQEEGADIVVRDLGEISVDEVFEWFETDLIEDGWNLRYATFKPEEEKLRETLTAIGNGYLGTRGAYEGSRASLHHYPGTYLAGVFNKIPSEVHGETIYNNDFVNCPNWLPIEFRICCGDFIDPFEQKILSYRQDLDFKNAVMNREIVIQDNLGRVTRISSRRFASMDNPHLCAQQFSFLPINYTGDIEFRTAIDGTIENKGVARYSALASDHLEHVDSGTSDEGIFLHVQTNSSHYQIVTHAKSRVTVSGSPVTAEKNIESSPRYIAELFKVPLESGQECTIEKIVTYHTSLDNDHDDPKAAGDKTICEARSFTELLEAHSSAWEKIWDKSNISIDGDRFSQKALRFHTYHLLGTASPHNPSIDAGMPARGLNGEAYRGHIFWDEIYILPFFIHHFPDIAKALLMYRYNRLDAARAYARENGFNGAMFPWQTADDGSEETQIVHYNPQSGTWGPDLSRNQRHVSIAVFYNTWRYAHETEDILFLEEYGAEMLFEIARFWAGIARHLPDTNQYHIEGVMGPDEFHEKLPESHKEGLKDNAYTNIMTAWLLEKAVELSETLDPSVMDKLVTNINLGYDEIEEWKKICSNMHIIVTKDGILEQFDGYMGLKELDWDQYRKKYGNIHRMDRILKAEGDSPDNYKVAKQADVLMTFYALSPIEVKHILENNGHNIHDAIKMVRDNYAYYEPRTSHGSTLSKVVHAIISSYLHDGHETAWRWFSESLKSDIEDTQGGTTQEGIHCGVMGGTLDTATRYFAGISFTDDMLNVHPNLPEHWRSLDLKICFRNSWYHLTIAPQTITVQLLESQEESVSATIAGHKVTIAKGEKASRNC